MSTISFDGVDLGEFHGPLVVGGKVVPVAPDSHVEVFNDELGTTARVDIDGEPLCFTDSVIAGDGSS